MFVIRPIAIRDLDQLEHFAHRAAAGIFTLPKDRSLLKKRIEASLASFSCEETTLDPHHYAFVLTDTAHDKAVGTSAIYTRTERTTPSYFYRIEAKERTSPSLHISWKEKTLHPVSYRKGPTEICSLYLLPKLRRMSVGRLLSLSRFLFMAEFPHRFNTQVIAMMRGVSSHACPFWKGLGKHFLDMSFSEVSELFTKNQEFVADFMPQHPIYASLLPEEAQKAIGKPHRNTKPALKLLEGEGFRFTGEIDIFDGGPKVGTEISRLRTVRDSQHVPVAHITPHLKTEVPFIISNTSLDFRACYGDVEIAEHGAILSPETAQALRVEEGDSIRFVTRKLSEN